MNTFNKYFGLVALIIGGFLGTLFILVLIFFLLKMLSITFFNLPGTDSVFKHLVTLTPYIIYFSAYYYINKKIGQTPALAARITSRFFLVIGASICTFTMTLALLSLWGFEHAWLRFFDTHSYLALIAQILFLFFTTVSMASGDAKEKDWMDRPTA
ncbi:MAG: hypothetical protein RLY16_736 [Bacteroidota bacterium]|jgi:hypothetical protein